MELRKAYFDAVAASGETWIAYRVDLQWLGLNVRYTELSGTELRRPRARLRLGRRRRDDAATDFAFRDPPAAWVNHPPSWAHVHETESFKWRLTGVGGDFRCDATWGAFATYSEELTLKASPWRLGLTTLSWGRLVLDDLFVTWIVADGERPVSFAAVNAVALVGEAVFDGQTLRTPVCDLHLGRRLKTISSGRVTKVRGAHVNALAAALFGLGDIEQEKFSAECIVEFKDGHHRTGVAVAETVKFIR